MNDTLLTGEVRKARERLAAIGQWYAGRPKGTPAEEFERVLAADEELERVARLARVDLVDQANRRAGPFDPPLLSALLEVARERFVRPEDVGESSADTPLLLDEEGFATISAPHAYLLSYRELGLARGDRLVELGTGSGYGAALASQIVGPAGRILTIEIDEGLARRAQRLLGTYSNVRVLHADAGAVVATWSGWERVTVTYAVSQIPPGWLDALPEGGRMVAPVGRSESQRLMLIERIEGAIQSSDRGAVRYVRDRGAAEQRL